MGGAKVAKRGFWITINEALNKKQKGEKPRQPEEDFVLFINRERTD